MKKTFLTIGFGLIVLVSCSKKQPAPAPAPPPPVNNEAAPSPNPPITLNPITLTSGGAYANDLGPKTADSNKYSEAAQKGYQLLIQKCSSCHTSARPLNAQYIDLGSPAIEYFKTNRPELFENKFLLQLENGVWKRKVKQMAGKPAANISTDEAKAIYQFLLEFYLDQFGANGERARNWIAHRKKLLEEFKQKYPERYQLLYGD